MPDKSESIRVIVKSLAESSDSLFSSTHELLDDLKDVLKSDGLHILDEGITHDDYEGRSNMAAELMDIRSSVMESRQAIKFIIDHLDLG